MATHVCIKCGIGFTKPGNAPKKYCSNKCHYADMKLGEKNCPTCKKNFVPEKSKTTFCSKKCFSGKERKDCGVLKPEPITDAKFIPLTQGKFAIVDENLFDEISKYKWLTVKVGNKFYAKRSIGNCGEERKYVYMHTYIRRLKTLDIFEGDETDHINNNGLDNRVDNIRGASHSQNHANRSATSATGFKGVSVIKTKDGYVYVARIMCNGIDDPIGRFKTAEEAARAYDARARELHGGFGRYNFPEIGEQSARGEKPEKIKNKKNKTTIGGVTKNMNGFRGVWKKNKRYTAKVMVDGHWKYFGWYDTPEEAARAYDNKIREIHGERGAYNFPLPGERYVTVKSSEYGEIGGPAEEYEEELAPEPVTESEFIPVTLEDLL